MLKTLTILISLSFIQAHASRPLDENEKWTEFHNIYTSVCDWDQTSRDYKKQEEINKIDKNFKAIYGERGLRIETCINFIEYFETRKAWWSPPPQTELNDMLSKILRFYGSYVEEQHANIVDIHAQHFNWSRSHPQNSNRLDIILTETKRLQTAADKYYVSWYPSVFWSWSKFVTGCSLDSLFTQIEKDIDEILLVYNHYYPKHSQSNWKQWRQLSSS